MLYSDNALGQWSKQTGIYLPASVDIDKGFVDVLFWLHGWYVPKIQALFDSDRSAIRRQVVASGKPIVLVAPYLGNGQPEGSSYDVSDLNKAHWGELYLNQVLGVLEMMRDPNTYTPPWMRRDLSLLHVKTGPDLRIRKLIIACHSGGGEAMRYLVGSLGRYRRSIAACWGFDCLYGQKASPDDATFWYDWAATGDGPPLYISYGKSTVPQSVKLSLMRDGVATRHGARREPEGAELQRIEVKLGIKTAKHADDLMELDDLLNKSTPKPGRPPGLGNAFVGMAAANLKKNAPWPAELMEMHYAIARDGLLEKLKGAPFL
jgi:hypothetical protein